MRTKLSQIIVLREVRSPREDETLRIAAYRLNSNLSVMPQGKRAEALIDELIGSADAHVADVAAWKIQGIVDMIRGPGSQKMAQGDLDELLMLVKKGL